MKKKKDNTITKKTEFRQTNANTGVQKKDSIIVLILLILFIVPAVIGLGVGGYYVGYDVYTNSAEKDVDGNTALIRATIKEDIKKIQSLLDNNIPLNTKNAQGETALMIATQNANVEIVTLFIKEKAKLNITNNVNETALMIAVKNNNYDIVQLLINAGTNLDIQDENENTALIIALQNKYTNIVPLLIEAGSDVNIEGDLAILFLVINNGLDIDLIRTIIEKGADLNAQGDNGQTPIMLSLSKNLLDITLLLLEYTMDMSIRDEDNNTALLTAVLDKDIQVNIVSKLLNQSSDVNAINTSKQTALHIASKRGRLDVVEVLLAAGAEKTVRDNNGRTPLLLAALHGHRSIVSYLMTLNAEPNKKDYAGNNALMLASLLRGNASVVKTLLNAGLDVTQENKRSQNAYDLALSKNNKTIMKILRNAFALLDSYTDDYTVLMWAALKADIPTVQELLKTRISPNFISLDGSSALSLATQNESNIDITHEIIASLIIYKANPNVFGKTEITPLMWAAKHKRADLVSLLLHSRANPNLLNKRNNGALSEVITHNNGDNAVDRIVTILLNRGANPNETIPRYTHPILWAVEEQKFSIIDLLLKKNANINFAGADGTTPLIAASKHLAASYVRKFLEKGAIPSAKNKEGDTAFTVIPENLSDYDIDKNNRVIEIKDMLSQATALLVAE